MRRTSIAFFAAVLGCSSHPPMPAPVDAGSDQPDTGPVPDAGRAACVGCRSDGQSCGYSIECGPDSICNCVLDENYVPTQPNNVCVKVLCSSDSECSPPKQCSIARICEAPQCWADRNCPMDQICSGGRCAPPPHPDFAVRCEVTTHNAVLRPGVSFPLEAIAYDSGSAPLAGIDIAWSSTSTAVADVSGSGDAVGGPVPGMTTIRARVAATGLACDGSVQVVNVGGTGTSFTLVAEDTYEPVQGATLTLFPGPRTAVTSTAGTVQFPGLSAVTSITIVKSGFVSVSILGLPAGGFYEIPLPREIDPRTAAGFTGTADMTKTRLNEVVLGFAGSALRPSASDFGLRTLLCDSTVEVDGVPELGIDGAVTIPSGGIIAVGANQVTASTGGSTARCRSSPTSGHVGCFDAPANPGQGPAWLAAGQMHLSEIVALGASSEICDGAFGFLPDGLFTLGRHLSHGLAWPVDFQPAPRIDRPGGAGDCMDLSQPSYDAICQGNFAKYAALDLTAGTPLDVHAEVELPPVPPRYPDGPCFPQILMIAGYALPASGLIPLGFGSGSTGTGTTAGPGGCLAGAPKDPFGPTNVTLPLGTLPLVYAHPHAGIDRVRGGGVMVTAFALDRPAFTGTKPLVLAGVTSVPTASVGPNLHFARTFLATPSGTVDTVNLRAQVTVPAGTDIIELRIRTLDKNWIIYAPGDTTTIAIPNPTATMVPIRLRPDIKALMRALALARTSSAPFGGYFDFSSPAYFGSAARTVSAFSLRECRPQDLDCAVR